MQSHPQALARMKEELAEQSAQFRGICNLLERLDPRMLLSVSDELLEEIDAVCSTERPVSPNRAPVRGIRA